MPACRRLSLHADAIAAVLPALNDWRTPVSTATFVLDTEPGRERFLAGVLGYLSGVRHVTVGREQLIVTVDLAVRADAELMRIVLRNLLYVKAVSTGRSTSWN